MTAGTLHVGVISDTHGLLRRQALDRLRGCDHILHAGDVGDIRILDALRSIAPVTAIRGNVDTEGPCSALHPTEAIELGGVLFYLVHSLEDLNINPAVSKVGAVISGHSHEPLIERHEGVLYLNPGSAGPRRFSLPVTLATVEISSGIITPRIHRLM